MSNPFAIASTPLPGLSSMGVSQAMPSGPAGNPHNGDTSLILDHPQGTEYAFDSVMADSTPDDQSNSMHHEEWDVIFHLGEKVSKKLDFDVNFDEDSLEPMGARLGPVHLGREEILALLKVLSDKG